MKIEDLRVALLNGSFDADLKHIKDCINARLEMLALFLERELKPGDRVRIINIRPKYLDGASGTVMGKAEGGRIRVKLDKPTRGHATPGVFPSCIERI